LIMLSCSGLGEGPEWNNGSSRDSMQQFLSSHSPWVLRLSRWLLEFSWKPFELHIMVKSILLGEWGLWSPVPPSCWPLLIVSSLPTG
jgi:hypothetical protein